MHQDSASLSALIGSRICHDLISPIGAISNGLELVAMGAPGSASPEMTLIQQSCDNATARIRFFRIAFGTGDDQREIPAPTARAILADHFRGSRIRPAWDMDRGIGRDVVQLAYLAALCVESALTQGGDIRIVQSDATVIAIGQGPVVQRDATLWARLGAAESGTPGALRAAHVQFALLAEICARGGVWPDIAFTPDQVRIALPLPPEHR